MHEVPYLLCHTGMETCNVLHPRLVENINKQKAVVKKQWRPQTTPHT